ncbi:MAG TPA: heparinase II/III family protein, partial [Oceanipulchritudo sp.]|nr:heparinase II/III family protein [Oceanipulchritudo sp.]
MKTPYTLITLSIPHLIMPFRSVSLLLVAFLSTILVAQADLVHPRIWVTPADRDSILDKIENHSYAADLFEQLKARADEAVSRHQADREGFLRALPLDWSRGTADHPLFRKITGDESDRPIFMNYLQDAIDCGILYYLTGDEAYAQCAADIMGVFVSAMAHMERSQTLGNGGLIYPSDHLKEARIIGAQIPIACDFIQPFVRAHGRVYDLVTGGERAFPFEDAQKTFQTYVDMAIEVGHTGSNWSVLESSSLLGNLLSFDSEEKIRKHLPYYLNHQSERQDPLSTVAESYPNPGDIWPESLQYSRHVASFTIYLMTILDKLYPDLNLAQTYPNILEAPSKDYLLQYPNGHYVYFGDGHRRYRTDYPTFEKAYLLADMAGLERYTRLYGSLLKEGLQDDYDRSRLAPRTFAATVYKSPLKLLWSVPKLEGHPGSKPTPRTVELPFAGIYIQRNLETDHPTEEGLMGFVGGGHYVHGHASGMNIELYGKGHVLGVDAGKGKYRTDIHENYYRIFAAHNTVISNGASASSGGWVNLGIEPLQLVDIEPMPGKRAVSSDHSFSTTRFNDLHNLIAPAEHERTLAVIRTSATTGYYVDI